VRSSARSYASPKPTGSSPGPPPFWRCKKTLQPELHWLLSGWWACARHPSVARIQCELWLDQYVGHARTAVHRLGWEPELKGSEGGKILAALTRAASETANGRLDASAVFASIDGMKQENPMVAASSTVLFAIQAGVRLYGAGRRAYADATKDKPLVLPLPKADATDLDGADNWFSTSANGKRALEDLGEGSRAAVLMGKDSLTPEEEKELVEIYRVVRPLYDPDAAKLGGEDIWDVKTLGAVLTVRQWSKEKPADHPSPLQTVAGTLIEIAVDYFISTPGAVDESRPQGRAIKAFLEAIDDTQFASTPLPAIAPGLFVALLDSVSAQPDLIAGGPKEKELVTEVTKSLAASMVKAFEPLSEHAQGELLKQQWPELIARAFFEGGARTVLAHPTTYLGARQGAEGTIVASLISTFTGLVLTDTRVDLRGALSSAGLQTMVRAALSAVADNPGVLDLGEGKEGIEQVIVRTIAAIPGRGHLLAADLVPEILSLVLRNTAANLPAILAHDGKDPRKNLAIVATGAVLRALSDNNGTHWDPPLTQSQVLAVLQTVLDEVVRNPDWLARHLAGDDPVLEIALSATLASLGGVADKGLSGEVMTRALQAAIAAVVSNLSLLDKLPDPATAGTEIASTQVLDLVFDQILGKPQSVNVKWRLANAGTLSAVIEIALDAIARHNPTTDHIEVLKQVLEELVAGTIAVDRLRSILDTRLKA